jgi:diacylglycerol kinase (ATP)
MSARRSPSVLQSFNFAFEGVIHVLRTQRNLRIHFAIAVVVLVAALLVDVTRTQLVALMLAITFVLIAEMVNTAIEATIDVATTSFDPLAKLAKDIAAGAVLIAAVNAIAVGYLIFENEIRQPSARLITYLREADTNMTLIALVITIIAVIATKAISGRGTPLRGGLPSGHAALAFGGWIAITFVTGRVLASAVAFAMAVLVAQTRVESGIHSASEVAYGAIVGTLVTMLIFQLAA